MTQDEVRAWLKRDTTRCVLVEMDYMYQVGVGGSAVPTTGTLFFSNMPYTDATGPTPYVDAVSAVPTFKRELDRTTLRGHYSSTFGNFTLDNSDGDLDYVLALPIDGSEIRVYVGEVTWAKADFVHLFSALALKTSSAQPGDLIDVEMKDTSLLLNQTIGGNVVVGGTGPSANAFRPLNLGWVHQMAPILIDGTVGGGKYGHSDTGTNTAAVNVRDNGAPLVGSGTDYTENGDGTFTLTANPQSDQITADVLATRSGGTLIGYRVSDVMATLVGDRLGLSAMSKYSGPQYTSLVGGLNDYPMGKSITAAENAWNVIDEIMETFNGFAAIDRFGSFYFSRMRPDALSTVVANSGGAITVAGTMTDDDGDDKQIQLDHAAPGFATYQNYVNVNQVQQTQFAGTLSQAGRDMLSRVGYVSPSFLGEEPTSTQYLGSIAGEPFLGGAPQLYHKTLLGTSLVSTLISGASDTAIPDSTPPADTWTMDTYAEAWVSLRRAQNLPWQEFLDRRVGLDWYFLELGHIVNVDSVRFGMNGGVLMQVCSINIDPMNGVDVGLVRRRFAGVSGPLPSVELREDGGIELREDGGRELRE